MHLHTGSHRVVHTAREEGNKINALAMRGDGKVGAGRLSLRWGDGGQKGVPGVLGTLDCQPSYGFENSECGLACSSRK